MSSAEEALAQGVKDGKIPFAIIAATTADGELMIQSPLDCQQFR